MPTLDTSPDTEGASWAMIRTDAAAAMSMTVMTATKTMIQKRRFSGIGRVYG